LFQLTLVTNFSVQPLNDICMGRKVEQKRILVFFVVS